MPQAPLEVGSKYICIEISETGETKIEAVGFHGLGCEAATKQIEINLGQVTGRKKKPEADSFQGVTLKH